MGKNSIKNLVGQPIFKQILNLLPTDVINRAIIQHQSDRYYKSFSTFDQLVALLFGVFERCENVYQDVLLDIIYQMLKNKTGDWFLIRSQVEPCKKCIYNFLCPPVSNYEFVMNSNNLCNVCVKK